jgi:hypothetical protein
MAAIRLSDYIKISREGVEYKAFVGDLPMDTGGGNDIDLFVNKIGDTMEGPLLLHSLTPTLQIEAASMHYVDAEVAKRLPLDFKVLPPLT